jgi:hypothetical protein
MNRVFAVLACVVGACAIAGPVAAGVSVGVNDDAGKYADGDPQFWQTMAQNGLKQNAVTVLWDETQPLTILDQSFIANALPAAQAAGIDVVFDVYPMHSQAFTRNGATYEQFGAFLTKLAQTFPQVTEYVVMNECNQTRFVNPQFDGLGVNQSASVCGSAVAAGYDALKTVNPNIFVWGIGLSPRGNDNAQATSNVSTSPVNFLKALGKWYRAQGRSKPLMDGFDFHPYPIPQSLDFATGYADQQNAAVSNLPRVYQAFYDAFNGTPQRTIGQQNGGGLPVSLNEVGIQTDDTGKAGYTGTENAATADGGVRGDTATEAFQSSWYVKMLDYVACDANVKSVNIFHLVDESDLGGWQSGLYYLGYAPKASASAVSSWIAGGGSCTGGTRTFVPSITSFDDRPSGSIQVQLSTFLSYYAQKRSVTLPVFAGPDFATALSNFMGTLGFSLQAMNLTADIVLIKPRQISSARNVSGAVKVVATKTVTVKKGNRLKVGLKLPKKLKPGYYKLRLSMKAVKGTAKATVTTKPFYLRAGGKLRK